MPLREWGKFPASPAAKGLSGSWSGPRETLAQVVEGCALAASLASRSVGHSIPSYHSVQAAQGWEGLWEKGCSALAFLGKAKSPSRMGTIWDI